MMDIETMRGAVDAIATGAENVASVARDRAYSRQMTGSDQQALLFVAQGFSQLAVELREIASGQGVVRSTTKDAA